MAQFDDAKVGDRVCDYLKGWGEIKKIDDSETPIAVIFEKDREENNYWWYSREGVEYSSNNPTLFWGEVKIVAPERPKPHQCSFMHNITRQEVREYGQCECGKEAVTQINVNPNFNAKHYDKPKEKCEACERIKEEKSDAREYYKEDSNLIFLLNQHHVEGCKHSERCEKNG